LGQNPWLSTRLLSVELPKALITAELQLTRRFADFTRRVTNTSARRRRTCDAFRCFRHDGVAASQRRL